MEVLISDFENLSLESLSKLKRQLVAGGRTKAKPASPRLVEDIVTATFKMFEKGQIGKDQISDKQKRLIEACRTAFPVLYEHSQSETIKKHLMFIFKLLDCGLVEDALRELWTAFVHFSKYHNGRVIRAASPKYEQILYIPEGKYPAPIVNNLQLLLLRSVQKCTQLRFKPLSNLVSGHVTQFNCFFRERNANLQELVNSFNREDGPVSWVRKLPVGSQDQKLDTIGKLLLSISNSASLVTAAHLRLIALRLMPSPSQQFFDLLLKSLSAVNKSHDITTLHSDIQALIDVHPNDELAKWLPQAAEVSPTQPEQQDSQPAQPSQPSQPLDSAEIPAELNNYLTSAIDKRRYASLLSTYLKAFTPESSSLLTNSNTHLQICIRFKEFLSPKHALVLSNYLFKCGESLQKAGKPHLDFWVESIAVDKRAPENNLTGPKIEKLALYLATSGSPQKALAYLVPAIQAKLPQEPVMSITVNAPTVQTMVNVLCRIALDNPSVEFPLTSSEIWQLVLQTIAQSSSVNKVGLAETAVQFIFSQQERPACLLRSLAAYFNIAKTIPENITPQIQTALESLSDGPVESILEGYYYYMAKSDLPKACAGFIRFFESTKQKKIVEANLQTALAWLDQVQALLEMYGLDELRCDMLKSALPWSSDPLIACQLVESYLHLGYTSAAASELEKLPAHPEDNIAKALILLTKSEYLISVADDSAKSTLKDLGTVISNDKTLSLSPSQGRAPGETPLQFQQRIHILARSARAYARICMTEGDNGQALVYIQNAVRILQGFLRKATSSGYSSLCTWPLISLTLDCQVFAAKAFEKLGVAREAKYYIRDAINLADSIGCGLKTAVLFSIDGEMDVKMNQFQQAQSALERCEDIMDRWKIKDVNFLQLVHSLALFLQRQQCYAEENVYYDMSDTVFSQILTKSQRHFQKTSQSRTASRKDRRLEAGLQVVHNNILRAQVRSLSLQDYLDNANVVCGKIKPVDPRDSVLHETAKAHLAYLQARNILLMDPAFCSIQDCALSVPCVTNAGGPKRGRKSAHLEALAMLVNARDAILDFKETALKVCSAVELNEISVLLNNIYILIHSIDRSSTTLVNGATSTQLLFEFSKGYSMQQEAMYLKLKADGLGLTDWVQERPEVTSTEANNVELQSILPSDWLVVSINYCKDTGNLMITRVDHDETFILSLPLNRHVNYDEDFSFEDGVTRLRDIIRRSNALTNSSKTSTIKTKEDRQAWWQERFELDKELKELLDEVEFNWLGGFRGIFSDNKPIADLRERFHESMKAIMSRSFPSRSSKTAKGKSSPVEIHPMVFDLLLGIGYPETSPDPALWEDLIYFMLDILQFHGEHNAYDELDTDEITIDIEEALRSYYSRIGDFEQKQYAHTVLVVDKSCHIFPWESLPFLRDRPVSRVPSFAVLKDLLQRQQFHIERKDVFYMLNPGKDLVKTQERFEGILEGLDCGKGLIGQAPTEDEFADALTTNNLLVYLGHGGGEQYIRSGRIKALRKCCPTFLLGCSSGALKDAGDYEPWGTPISYLTAGCPMLVANMWDVTDKDIDTLSIKLFESWGLFESESGDQSRQDCARALAKCRNECTLKYLNGAAPVLYGIPMKLS